MIQSPAIRKLLAFGTGVGIEVEPRDLAISVVKVRPSGVRLVSSLTVNDFRTRPAAEWGEEVSRFLKSAGARHLAAEILLPRNEVIVRHLHLPGVNDKDVPSALAYQVDSLHPYGDDETVWDWARLNNSPNILVGIVRREVVDRYATLFTEAGIRVSGFTFSAAALFSGARLLHQPSAEGFVSLLDHGQGEFEVYGESPARAIYSAAFDLPAERVQLLAASELRLPAEQPPVAIRDILPRPTSAPEGSDPRSLSYAAALSGACPWLGLRTNLLPPDLRHTNSRMIYVPTVVLASVLLLVGAALAVQGAYEDHRYLAALKAESEKVEAPARRVGVVDKNVETLRSRTRLLDEFRYRSHADMDVLKEVTRILPPPTWLNGIEISRNSVTLSGETDQAAALLKVLDASPLFEGSTFAQGISKAGTMEVFRIRTDREGPLR